MGPQPDFNWLVSLFTGLVLKAIPVVAGLALLTFFWGLTKFIARVGGDEKAVAEGKSLMIWGLIALFIMISIWGLISFFSNELGFGPGLVLPLLPS